MITDKCYEAIRRDILTCKMKPGSAVTEDQLCEVYEVGKAPVRAALVRLGQEGLVKSIRRHGYVVTPISLRDVEELYQLRLLLESAVVAEVARSRPTKEMLADLLESASCAPPTNIIEGMERNHAFHLGLARFTGNQRIVALIERLLDDSDRFIYLWMSGGAIPKEDLTRGEYDHAAILSAVQSGDAAGASAAMLSHIEDARAAIVSNLMGRSSKFDLIVSPG